MLKFFLRYLIFVGVPYAIARKIEKAYLEYLDRRDENDGSDNDPSDITDIRGGEFITLTGLTGIVTFLMQDFALRAAITGLIGSTIWSDTADTAASQVAKYAAAIVGSPGNKFRKILKKLQGIDADYTRDIKEILLEKNLSNQDKLELIKVKVQYALKDLRGRRRITFLLTLIALLVFFLGHGTPAFAYFMTGLRELIGKKDDEDSIKDYLIDIYKEYNAPLPEELITQITKELSEL